MSLNYLAKLLSNLGFSILDAKVYVYVAKLGPLSNEEIVNRLEIRVEQLNPILQKLTEKGIITSALRNQRVYSALPFENLLDDYIKLEIKQADEIRRNREQLISSWKSLTKINDE